MLSRRMLIPSLFVLLTICAFFTALTAAPLYADPLSLTDLNSRAPSSQVPLDAKAVGSIHASISLSEQITSTGESFDPPLDPSQTTVYETGSDRTKTSVVSSAANSRAEINATLDTQSVQSSIPAKLYESTFRGGVVTGGFAVGALASGAGSFDVNIPPDSTIRRAYLLAGRVGNAADVTVDLNGTSLTFTSANIFSTGFNTGYGGNSAVHAIDVTAFILPSTTTYTITVPAQATTSNRYPEFYLYIAFDNSALSEVTSTIFANTTNLNIDNFSWALTTTNPIATGYPVGLAIFGGYTADDDDQENVTVNGTLVGSFGGADFNALGTWGSMAGFQYYNGTLTGYGDDNADQLMDGVDALSNIQALIPDNTTSFTVDFQHTRVGGTDNHVWALFLTSVGELSDLVIDKTVAPINAVPGAPITYTLHFSNTGAYPATNITLSDNIPVSVSINSVVSSTVGSGVTITQTSGVPNFAWTVSDLAPGAGGILTLTGTLSGSLSAGVITNTATITASNDVTTTNNSSSVGVDVFIPVCFATHNDGATVFESADSQAVRNAVAAASAGGTVKIAGTCAGTVNEDGTDQLVRVMQPITLAGGYTTTNWITPSAVQTTTLDALYSGRVIQATAAATVQALTIQNGYVTLAGDAGRGGGINSSQPLTLSHVFLYNNATTGANASGGGAYVRGKTIITNTTFFSNTAGIDTGGRGGGISIAYENTNGINVGSSITGTTFLSNTAGDRGGGLGSTQRLQIMGTSFLSNTAGAYGGGAYLGNAATMTNTDFIGNGSGELGGGAYSESSPWITGGSFQSNTTVDAGGGIYVSGRGSITGTTFISNTAGAGGGIFIEGISFGPSYVLNSRFTDNRSFSNQGDVLYAIQRNHLFLLHNTIANQSSEDGAAIYISNANTSGGLDEAYTTAISNTIVSNQAIAVENVDSTVSQDFNLFDNVTTPISGTVTGGGNSIIGNAAFADAANGDFQLTALSDAINAGTDAGITTDFFGDPRPQQGGFDIGFDESPFAPAHSDLIITKQAQPTTVAAGEAITYTLTFTNAGPGAASGVVISDSVPGNVDVSSDQWSVI